MLSTEAITKFVESSPVIVGLLMIVIGSMLYYGSKLIQDMLTRVDAKDATIVQMQKDTLTALHQNTVAIQELKHALDRSR